MSKLCAISLIGACAIVILSAAPASADAFTVLYNFTNGSDGGTPAGDLVLDSRGNLYGATVHGGVGNGVVYELSATGMQSILHAFQGGDDGAFAYAGLTRGQDGTFYGVTNNGGGSSCSGGCGTVFRITPKGKEEVLHAFSGGSDGANPDRPLAIDSAGNLYGTALAGGDAGLGVVFKLTPDGTESVLHNFVGGDDGSAPAGGVILDHHGNLYGTTAGGGGSTNCTGGCGIVFELSANGKERILHVFGAAGDGQSPYSGLAMGNDRRMYGVTYAGGDSSNGVVFSVTKDGVESVLHSFAGGNDGAHPEGVLIRDKHGALYGDTANGGGACDCGTVFSIATDGSESVLHGFVRGDGGYPYGGLALDSNGNLYGTTYSAGTHNAGTVFRLKR